MGAALIFPVVAAAMLAVIWFVVFAKRTREQAARDQALPDDPYERRQTELEDLRREHEEADPARAQHPARRP
jgi:hypothetical protein